MYKVDLVLTLDDRDGHPYYNRVVVPKLLSFINYPVNIIISLHKPLQETVDRFKKYQEDGIINKLHMWHDNIGHMPKDLNKVFVEAFSLIESEYVVHFDGDMFAYRKGYDNWLEKFIEIIERREHNVGAICHTNSYNRFSLVTQRVESRRQVINWVSTRFFVTKASMVRSGMNHPKLFLDWPETYAFEGAMYINGLHPEGLRPILIPFNPDFLIVHCLGMTYWQDKTWSEYEDALRNNNEILIQNIAHSDWGDLYGDGRDLYDRNTWGERAWETSGNDGEIIELLP